VEARSLNAPIVCLVTSGTSRPSLETIRAAAQGGVDLIHVRERYLDDRSLAALVRAVLDVVGGTGARVVVNDRLDVALATGAAGVHLRGDSMAATDVRRLAPEPFLVGRSVHSVEEAENAERGGGVDYLVFGTVFPSVNKPDGHPIAGVDALRRACAAVRLPILAIGGVSEANVVEVVAAGAAGVAAIGLFAANERVADTVRTVRRLFDTCYPRPA
jgi:thiamine-phosphate diphosphorylase